MLDLDQRPRSTLSGKFAIRKEIESGERSLYAIPSRLEVGQVSLRMGPKKGVGQILDAVSPYLDNKWLRRFLLRWPLPVLTALVGLGILQVNRNSAIAVLVVATIYFASTTVLVDLVRRRQAAIHNAKAERLKKKKRRMRRLARRYANSLAILQNENPLQGPSAAYNSMLADVASEMNTVSERVLVAKTSNGWDPRNHTWDGTHPNPTGESLIAQRVAQELNRLGAGGDPDIYRNLSWNVAGPTVSVNPGPEVADLGWNRVPTGSTGMFIDVKLVGHTAWQTLPYAVPGDGWRQEALVAGGNYTYRLRPNKGLMTGTPGPASTEVRIPAKPFDAVASSAVRVTGENWANVSWPAARNSSGYVLSTKRMLSGPTEWQELPYAIDATQFTFELLTTGVRYRFGVASVRGFVTKAPALTPMKRLRGVPTARLYAALGDSYSSGLGSDESQVGTSCLRFRGAWAYDVQPGYNSKMRLFACAGDETSDLRRDQVPSMKSWISEQPASPVLVTLTIGGNDVGFADELENCVRSSSACTSREATLNSRIDALYGTLRSTFAEVREAQPRADIIVGGYPGLLEVGGNSLDPICLAIGDNERAMVNRLSKRLNGVIASAASAAGVWVVGNSIYDRFDPGHNACDANGAWIQNGDYRWGDGWIDPKSFHPNDSGQLAYALSFSDAIIRDAG